MSKLILLKKSRLIAGLLIVFILIGTVPAMATDASVEVSATISPQKIYVDGQRVELLAYNIGGNNYVRIRDAGKAVDFSVLYDAATDSVWLDRSQGYDGEITNLPVPGDNPTAKPSVQTIYARGELASITMYNIAGNNFAKLRDLGAALNFAIAYDPTADAVYIDRQTSYLPNMPPELLRPEAIPNAETAEPVQPAVNGEDSPQIKFIKEHLPEEYAAVKPFIDELAEMATNREKINAIVRYVCERMTYGTPNDPSIYERIGTDGGNTTRSMRYAMFLDPAPVKGICNDYAKAVDLLCKLAEIPTILIISYGSNHAWNAVYADGWYYVDSTNEDVADEPIPSDKDVLFAIDTPNLPFSDDNPQATKEFMEVLVPGSTK